jgi:hypothetical protein
MGKDHRFGAQGLFCGADTVAVIGPSSSAILADAQGGDEEAFACLSRAIQRVLLR